ncbi:MAG TPA: polysaccharide deacetylase family protein [Patescibacteria group bacterium]|nr:polysaccharide deacetylase family protein [Patescibacteria group bacterium]
MFALGRRQIFFVIAVIIVLMVIVAGFIVSGVSDWSVASQMPRDRGIDVPILAYHKVDHLNHSLSLPPEEFSRQLQYLWENGYRSITPDQLTAYFQYGRPLPEKPVMITFDDGYLDNYVNAYPILKKYGFTATIFIITDMIERDPRFMKWDQIREMQADHFIFGSHSVTHTPLNQLTLEQLKRELTNSADEMEKQLGQRPRYFAYPTGDYSANIGNQVKQAGYRAAFTIRFGQVGLGSNQYALERIPVFRSQQSFQQFFSRLHVTPNQEQLNIIRSGKYIAPR